MMIHLHLCSECGLEWRCYDLDCAGAHEMFCDECAFEQDLAADESPANQVHEGVLFKS